MAGKTGYCTLILVLLMVLLISQICEAQNTITYNRTYDFNNGVESGLSVLTLNDGYLIAGSGGASEFGGWRALKLVKVDFLGNVVWKKVYGEQGKITSVGWYSGFIKLYNGFFVAASIADSGNVNGRGIVYRFDNNGDTLWTRTFDTPEYELFNCARQTGDKGFLMVGTSYSPTNVPRYWLVKTDSMGITQWDTVMSGSGYASTIEVTNDGGYIIGGAGGNNLSTARIVKTDSMGNVEWVKNHFTGNRYGCYWAAGVASDGGYYIWGCNDTVIDPTDFYLTATVAKLDSVGNRVWTNHYRGLNNKLIAVYQVKELANGDIVIGGERDDENPLLSVGGWLLKMDNRGNTIWQKTHTYTQDSTFKLGSNSVYDFNTTSDGGLIVTGTAFNDIDPGPNFNNNQDIWLLKLDSIGNWYAPPDTACPPPCDTTGITETPTLQAKLYPNPTTGTLTIELPGGQGGIMALYNLLGQSMYQATLAGGQTTLALNLPPGLYLYRIGSGGKAVNGKLLVE